jgi:hypothetical protein
MVATQQAHPEVRWQIHCGKDPAWGDLKYEHIPFTPGNEPTTVRQFDIGLLPLPDGEFAQGKSPIKALQYFASGTTTLASGVGATSEMLKACPSAVNISRPALWQEAITARITSPADLRPFDPLASDAFNAQFEMKTVFQKLLTVLRNKK